MKKLTVLFLLLSTSLMMFSQKKEKIKGDKNVVESTQSIDVNFSSIQIVDNLKVKLQKGLKNSYTVNADKNLHDVINFSVTNGVLLINSSSHIVSSKKLDIKVEFTHLENIVLTDEAELIIEKEFESNLFNITAGNSSKFNVNVKAKKCFIDMKEEAEGKVKFRGDDIVLTMIDKTELDADLNVDATTVKLDNTASVKLDGKSDNVSFATNNSSEIDARKLNASRAELTLTDKSKIYIDANKRVSIEAIEKSKVYIYDDPQIEIRKFKDKAEVLKR